MNFLTKPRLSSHTDVTAPLIQPLATQSELDSSCRAAGM